MGLLGADIDLTGSAGPFASLTADVTTNTPAYLSLCALFVAVVIFRHWIKSLRGGRG